MLEGVSYVVLVRFSLDDVDRLGSPGTAEGSFMSSLD
jgi:hypothetical protein